MSQGGKESRHLSSSMTDFTTANITVTNTATTTANLTSLVGRPLLLPTLLLVLPPNCVPFLSFQSELLWSGPKVRLHGLSKLLLHHSFSAASTKWKLWTWLTQFPESPTSRWVQDHFLPEVGGPGRQGPQPDVLSLSSPLVWIYQVRPAASPTADYWSLPSWQWMQPLCLALLVVGPQSCGPCH